jgi:septum formation protein
MHTRPEILLASASPRRAQILRHAGIPFRSLPTHVDESRRPGEPPREYVLRLSREKVQSAAGQASGDAIMIGADTIVQLEGEIFGKPAGVEDARRILGRLSGQTHEVLTGVTLLRLADSRDFSFVETTRVAFAPLSPAQIEEYIATGEPFGKAGAYAIQGLASRFIERTDGDYFNVVGLPLERLRQALAGLGWIGVDTPLRIRAEDSGNPR